MAFVLDQQFVTVWTWVKNNEDNLHLQNIIIARCNFWFSLVTNQWNHTKLDEQVHHNCASRIRSCAVKLTERILQRNVALAAALITICIVVSSAAYGRGIFCLLSYFVSDDSSLWKAIHCAKTAEDTGREAKGDTISVFLPFAGRIYIVMRRMMQGSGVSENLALVDLYFWSRYFPEIWIWGCTSKFDVTQYQS